MGQYHRQGQQVFCFAAGVAIQDTLGTGSNLLTACHRCRDVRALWMDQDFHIYVSTAISGSSYRIAHYRGDVRNCSCGDFTGYNKFICGRQNFTGNAGMGIMFQAAVQHRVRYGITQFIRVARRDRLCCQDGLIFRVRLTSLSFWGMETASHGCTWLDISGSVLESGI